MKKRKLILLGFALFSLFCYSCRDYELEVPPEENLYPIPFSVRDAREFFENNATDLSPLSFVGESLSRSGKSVSIEMSPEWSGARISGHKGVTLIEIPLRSTSTILAQESIYKKGRKISSRNTVSERRLIMAKRVNGETDMFVVTIVPEAKSGKDDPAKMLKEFRYLGGGSFSGKVFCSTLEGKFVKAFGYTDGVLNGTLSTRVRASSNDSPTEEEEYSRLYFQDVSSTTTSMFAGSESGGGSGQKCKHGYYYSDCPYNCSVSGGDIGDVEVIICRYCGQRDGCICSKCFYCGRRDRECACIRCIACKKKMPECTCFEYPDPDKPVNPPGGGGGGDNPSTKPDVPNVSKLCDLTGSNLTNEQLQKIEKFIKELQSKYPKIKDMLEALSKLTNKPKIFLSSEETKGNVGRYDLSNNTIYYRDESALLSGGGFEEFIHVAQYQICYSEGAPNIRNIEFEAKMFYDMNYVTAGDWASWSSAGFSGDLSTHHSIFMDDFKSNQCLTPELLQNYHELGRQWNDPNYQKGKYDDSVNPQLIQKFYK